MIITQDIKDFLEHEGKVLVVEDGEPRFVLVRFHDYMRMAHPPASGGGEFLQSPPGRVDARPRQMSERDREVSEINRELEALAVEDLFLQNEPAVPKSSRTFYKEPD